MGTKATLRQTQAATYLINKGYAPSGAAAIVGNLSQESGVHLVSEWTTKTKEASRGIAQWNGPRAAAYEKFVTTRQPKAGGASFIGHLGRLDYQLDFIIEELKTMPKLNTALRNGGSTGALATDFCWQFERPNKSMANLVNRIAQAQTVFSSIAQGAPVAAQTNVKAAVDKQQAIHENAAIGGGVIAGGGAVIAAGSGLVAAAPTLPMWEWITIGIAAFLMVAGLVFFFTNRAAAAKLAAVKPQVDDTAMRASDAHPLIKPVPIWQGRDDEEPSPKEQEQLALTAGSYNKGAPSEVKAPPPTTPPPMAPGEASMSIGKAGG